jgi:peroxiredoxin Q/BCP
LISADIRSCCFSAQQGRASALDRPADSLDFLNRAKHNARASDLTSKGSRVGAIQREAMSGAVKSGTGSEVGRVAPDFELPDSNNKPWRLSSHRGKVVALVFYPKDETPVCTKQMCSMRDNWTDYEQTGAEVVAISVGTVESHKKFAENHGLPQTLLADEKGEATRLLNVKSFLGGSQRAVIVIDSNGVIRYRRSVVPVFRPGDDEVIKAIRDASA